MAGLADLEGASAPVAAPPAETDYSPDGGVGWAPGSPLPEEKPVKITGDADFDALAPGRRFLDPTGKLRTKPYTIKNDSDFEALPEGANFVDPAGQLRQKPKYEGIDFTAQTLYNMAVNDKERKRALERSYPGRVKELPDNQGFYVEEPDGTLRKPKGFTEAPGSTVAGAAVPVLGSIAGEIGGGLFGAPTGPGALVSAVAGGAVGGAAGQTFNDAIMQLAGVYDRSGGEQAMETGLSAVAGGAGTAIGRGISAVGPQIKGAVRSLLPKGVAHLLGAEPEAAATAASLAEQDVLVPPSAWMKEAPHVQNIVEVLDPAFRTQKPIVRSMTNYYEKKAGEFLESIGVKDIKSVVSPEAEPSTRAAGEALLRKTTQESKQADEALEAALAKRKTELTATVPETAKAGQQEVLRTAEQARKAAQALIDNGFQDIEGSVKQAVDFSKSGHNGGDLWKAVGDKLQLVRRGIMERHNLWYNQADEAAGGILPNTEGLPQVAKDFLSQLPQEFKTNYPSIVRQIEGLAEKTSPQGEVVKEQTMPTWGQLHNLRSQLRQNVDWYKLPADLKDGSYKFFERHINDILHDPNAPQELQLASRLLDATDRSYGENMAVFRAKNIKAVMDGLRAGEPGDPKALFDAIVREGHSDLTKKVLDLVGPNLAAGVRAADVQSMLDASRSLVPGQVDGMKFANEVLKRYRDDMLTPIHGESMSGKLLSQAQKIAALNGKIDVQALPGDTAMDVIARARVQGELAKEAARADPLQMLKKEMQKIERDHAKEVARMKRERQADPLGFLYNPTVGANEAVERILNNEDLIIASASKFGPQSPEFELMRQVWAQRVLMGSLNVGEKLAKVSPEVQQIMFPGITLSQMQTFAKNMDFLLSSKGAAGRAGQSIMATEAVEHPFGRFIGRGGTFLPKIPGADFGARAALTKYYAFITKMASNPGFIRWIERGLNGDAAARELTKQELTRAMQRGGAMGAGIGESLVQPSPMEPVQ